MANGNVYSFRSGRSIKNMDPQTIGEELERIRQEKGGSLVAADVLEAAADAESPLHAGFEWDDSAAAKQYRMSQARRLIVSVRILNSPAGSNVPAFVSVRTPERGRSYVPTVEAMSDDELKVRVLVEIKTFLESLQRRYAHFEQVALMLGNLKKSVG